MRNLMNNALPPAPLMGGAGNYHPYGRMQSPVGGNGKGFGAGSSGGYGGDPNDGMYGGDGGAFGESYYDPHYSSSWDNGDGYGTGRGGGKMQTGRGRGGGGGGRGGFSQSPSMGSGFGMGGMNATNDGMRLR